jgi:hypothetical protein
MNRRGMPLAGISGVGVVALAVAMGGAILPARPASPQTRRKSASQETTEERKKDAAVVGLRRSLAREMTSVRRERGEREQARKAAKRQRDYDSAIRGYYFSHW